jgi:hypothetical protein
MIYAACLIILLSTSSLAIVDSAQEYNPFCWRAKDELEKKYPGTYARVHMFNIGGCKKLGRTPVLITVDPPEAPGVLSQCWTKQDMSTSQATALGALARVNMHPRSVIVHFAQSITKEEFEDYLQMQLQTRGSRGN